MKSSWKITERGKLGDVAPKVYEGIRDSVADPAGHDRGISTSIASSVERAMRHAAIAKTDGDSSQEIEVTTTGSIDVEGTTKFSVQIRALPKGEE